MLGKEEMEQRFGFHPGTDQTIPVHEKVREASRRIATFFDETLPDGREKNLALTKLQEASMWANAAIAMEAPLEK